MAHSRSVVIYRLSSTVKVAGVCLWWPLHLENKVGIFKLFYYRNLLGSLEKPIDHISEHFYKYKIYNA